MSSLQKYCQQENFKFWKKIVYFFWQSEFTSYIYSLLYFVLCFLFCREVKWQQVPLLCYICSKFECLIPNRLLEKAPGKGWPLLKKCVMNSWHSSHGKGHTYHKFMTLVYGKGSHLSWICDTRLVMIYIYGHHQFL